MKCWPVVPISLPSLLAPPLRFFIQLTNPGIRHLIRERQTLHVTGNCGSLAGNAEEIAMCTCVERLYLHVHYFVDEHRKPHAHDWCSEVVPTGSQDPSPARLPEGAFT